MVVRSLGRWLTGAQRAHPLSPTHIATRSEELQTAAAASSVPGLASRQWADTGPYGPVSGGSCLIAPPLGAHQSPRPPLLRCRLASVWRQLSYAPPASGSSIPPPPPIPLPPPHFSPPTRTYASGRACQRAGGRARPEATDKDKHSSPPPEAHTPALRVQWLGGGDGDPRSLKTAFHSQDPTRRRDPRRRIASHSRLSLARSDTEKRS